MRATILAATIGAVAPLVAQSTPGCVAATPPAKDAHDPARVLDLTGSDTGLVFRRVVEISEDAGHCVYRFPDLEIDIEHHVLRWNVSVAVGA